MLPHQLIYSLGIGNTELAMGARMIWSCSTCYLCQEHCPNQVELTDIFYNLKNGALKKIDTGAHS
jgi:heterodisulfide reductase subunit C